MHLLPDNASCPATETSHAADNDVGELENCAACTNSDEDSFIVVGGCFSVGHDSEAMIKGSVHSSAQQSGSGELSGSSL